MRIIDIEESESTIVLSTMELLAIAGALNEVCNGIDIPEFQTRLGVSEEFARDLMADVREILNRQGL